MAQYRLALEAGENRPMALFNMGNCLYLMKQVGRALASYQNAVEIAPAFVRPYLNIGGIYFSLDEIGLAISNYRRALELDPGNLAAIKIQGESHLKLGERAEALAYFEKGRRSDPADLDCYQNAAEMGENEVAVAGMLNIGKRLFKRGDVEGAKAVFARIKGAFPGDLQVTQALSDPGS
ncbi:MAG: tetratricopeptide repeat protein [Fibrobacteria bacterium]